MKKFVFSIILVVLITFSFWIWKKHHQARPLPFTTVQYKTIHHDVTAVGNILPVQSIAVYSPIAGLVGQISKDAGDYVKEGEPLLIVTPNPSPTTLAQYIADVAEDQSTLTAAQATLANDEYLLKHDIIPKNYSTYLTDQQAEAAAQAKLNYDQQKLSLIQSGETTIDGKEVNNTIPSPITGYILQRNVDVGSSVIALGDNLTPTTLFTIADMNHLIFKGTVDEMDTNDLHIGLPSTLTLAASPDSDITGVVSQLSLQSDEQNDLTANATNASSTDSPFDVGFEIEINELKMKQPVKMRSGYSATATLTTQTANHVLAIPERTLTFKKDKTLVRVLDSQTTSHLQPVTTGLSDGIHIEIKKGLALGDKIVDSQQDTGDAPKRKNRKKR